MIGVSNNKTGGKLIRFITHSDVTHNFVFTFPHNKTVSIIEASYSVQVVPFFSRYWDNPKYGYEIFSIENPSVTQVDIELALDKLYEDYAGKKYGKTQLLWFGYRWFKEVILRRKNVHREKNWITKGVICSELLFWYLKYLDPLFSEILKDYDGDTVQPNDMLTIIKSRPDIFRLIARQE